MDRDWYLFANDPDGEDDVPHKYLLTRMKHVVRTGTHFQRPKDFKVDATLTHSIGVYSGNQPERLHPRLSPIPARWFGDRRFHATQQFTQHPDGTAELTMDVAITPELQRLVLGWGSQVEVLAPRSLQESVWKEARAMTDRGPGLKNP